MSTGERDVARISTLIETGASNYCTINTDVPVPVYRPLRCIYGIDRFHTAASVCLLAARIS